MNVRDKGLPQPPLLPPVLSLLNHSVYGTANYDYFPTNTSTYAHSRLPCASPPALWRGSAFLSVFLFVFLFSFTTQHFAAVALSQKFFSVYLVSFRYSHTRHLLLLLSIYNPTLTPTSYISSLLFPPPRFCST